MENSITLYFVYIYVYTVYVYFIARAGVEYIPEFHDCPCYNILIPWLQRGSYITFFTLVGNISSSDISRR